MASRLVYNPKVWAYTKDAHGQIYDLAQYIVAGNVTRRVNQISSANLTLRNPAKIFTTPAMGVAFHPMDPITIFLQRLKGHPVRVFTGYLDKTPYYQLYPGTITLAASCTLKRLLYTFFDPSLPYVMSFMQRYGWFPSGDGSLFSKSLYQAGTADANPQNLIAFAQDGKTPPALSDAGLGKLLWATLFHIGEWKDENIYIEALPSGANGIAARMAALMRNFQRDSQVTQAEFTDFLSQVIGSTSQGNGGGAAAQGGNLTPANGSEIYVSNYDAHGGPVAGESKGFSASSNSGLIFAELSKSQGGATCNGSNISGCDFSTLGGLPFGAYIKLSYPGSNKTIVVQKVDVGGGRVSMGAQYREADLSQEAWNAIGGGGAGIIKCTYERCDQNGKSLANTSPTTSPPTNYGPMGVAGLTSNAGTGATATQAGSTAPGHSGSNNSNYHLPLDKQYMTPIGRTDDGVDIENAPDGASVYSITNGVVSAIASDASGFGPNYPVIGVTDGPLQGQYIYYGHVAQALVKQGDTVNAGQPIAIMGHTGDAASLGHGHIEIGFSDSGGNPLSHHGSGANASTPDGVHMRAVIDALVSGGAVAGTPATPGTNAGGGSTDSVYSVASAAAFLGQISFPTVQDMTTALILGQNHKGLMHDQNLLPFVQQLSQASLRNFMSLPNGDFFGFYPDYFGELGHRDPYWFIDDIEILDGGIDLTDENLATHVFVVGDTTWPANNELMNELFSAGAIDIFNAFESTDVIDRTTADVHINTTNPGLGNVMTKDEALAFLSRYGARPVKMDYPMVRSPIFEMFLAYQQFMLAWSRQFLTPFTFTFMPELFPGGKVGFPNHGLQMYVEEVSHSWDLQTGFTTQASLSAPSLLRNTDSVLNPQLPPNMVSAMVEPVRGQTLTSNEKGQRTKTPATQLTAKQLNSELQALTQAIN